MLNKSRNRFMMKAAAPDGAKSKDAAAFSSSSWF